MKYNRLFHNNILWGQITGRSESIAKSRKSSAMRPSSGVLKLTDKKCKLHEDLMTLPSTSSKGTTQNKEWLSQRKRESVLTEEDCKFENEYLKVNFVTKENGVPMSHTEHCSYWTSVNLQLKIFGSFVLIG